MSGFIATRVETVDGLPPFEKTLRRLADWGRVAKSASDLWIGLIVGEFAGEYWLSPQGAKIPWKKTKAFGSRPAPAKTLQRSGALLASYRNAQVTVRNVQGGSEISISPSPRLIYAAVQRGGSGKVRAADAAVPETIVVTPKMRAFLHYLGVHLRKATTVIQIPRRPHATVSPQLRTGLIAIFAANAAGRQLPTRFAA